MDIQLCYCISAPQAPQGFPGPYQGRALARQRKQSTFPIQFEGLVYGRAGMLRPGNAACLLACWSTPHTCYLPRRGARLRAHRTRARGVCGHSLVQHAGGVFVAMFSGAGGGLRAGPTCSAWWLPPEATSGFCLHWRAGARPTACYKLADVAYAFETLQTDRHLADYDTITPISLGTAQASVPTARRVIAGWRAIRGTDDAMVFLTALPMHGNWGKN